MDLKAKIYIVTNYLTLRLTKLKTLKSLIAIFDRTVANIWPQFSSNVIFLALLVLSFLSGFSNYHFLLLDAFLMPNLKL